MFFSDELTGYYRKSFGIDEFNVWGNGYNAEEIIYATQSGEPDWFNCVRNQFLASSVPSISHYNGQYFVVFAGYDPDEIKTKNNNTKYDPGHRIMHCALLKFHPDFEDNSVKILDTFSILISMHLQTGFN